METSPTTVPAHPEPLEAGEPRLGELIRQVVHGEHPTVKSIYFGPAGFRLLMKSGQVKSVTTVGRNDLCPCGSGKKFKKCCG